MNSASLQKLLNRGGAFIIGASFATSLASSCIYDVKGGYRAIIFDRIQGVKQDVKKEGTHFLVPWLQKAIIFDVRITPRNISTTTGSKDMQMLYLESINLWVPITMKEFFHLLVMKFLRPLLHNSDAGELITQREIVSTRIREELNKRAKEFNIELEDVSITHMTFGKEFTQAVELKQIAQQEAERARFVVEKAEQERQASVIRAEGEATAADLISAALQKAGPGLIQIRRLEASKEIASTLAASPNVSYLPSNGGQGGPNLLLSMK
ncbi:Prohibitin-1, subunit of the prohibitin complex (Phb1p-Phb2p) [Entomophthora muscae]|uniref:Prohibitin-1, subunit of the prohibitin complex (Phb1p-Phb2p) n=1 Tax=Entomophthora muscae TaxID=34485 RepID=A0ACC2UH01_9FUNG|nr:Prohibitin-1, subunit of the prohibitin complex (Phb1p-Phb2p) [Entomophthora muscae]